MTDLFRAYFDPNKHAQEIPIDLVVSDDKVDAEYVGKLAEDVGDPREMKAIVVIKHPKEEVYSVLDGHHRYRLHREAGCDTIRAAVVDDYVGLGFFLTQKGVFQPTPKFTKYVRVPLKRFIANTESFLREPFEVLKRQRKPPVDGAECGTLAPALEVRIQTTDRRRMAVLDIVGSYEEDLPAGFERFFKWAGPKGYVAGPAVGIYHDNPMDVAPEDLRSTVGCITTEAAEAEGDFHIEIIEPRTEAVILHRGPHEETGSTYDLLVDHINREGYSIAGPPMELFLNDWTDTPPEQLLTEIRIPVERV